MVNRVFRLEPGPDAGLEGWRWRATSLVVAMALAGLGLGRGDGFPIADRGVAMSVSSGGDSYLVGVENHLTTPTTIGAQLLSTNGAKIGELIPTGRSGIATGLAFDGANHLLIWEDDELGSLTGATGWKVYGQFISRAGVKVGTPFAITTAGIWFDGNRSIAFGGGSYLVTYTRLINPALGGDSRNRYVAGRWVQPDGAMGDEFRISSGFGKASEVAFDGSRFFVVWCEDELDREIRGRFVSSAGGPGLEVKINSGAAPSDNPKSVVFDGANYLVGWNEEVGGRDTGTWDAFGQLVSPAGDLVGGRITIAAEAGPQMLTTLSFDGARFLAVWSDMQNETNWNMVGQWLGTNGVLVGSRLALSTGAGNELGGSMAAHGRHLVIVHQGVQLGEGGIAQVESASGFFLDPPTPPSIQSSGSGFGVQGGVFGFSLTGPVGGTVVVEASPGLVPASWTPLQTNSLATGSAYFGDAQWLQHPGRFYRFRIQ